MPPTLGVIGKRFAGRIEPASMEGASSTSDNKTPHLDTNKSVGTGSGAAARIARAYGISPSLARVVADAAGFPADPELAANT